MHLIRRYLGHCRITTNEAFDGYYNLLKTCWLIITSEIGFFVPIALN